MSAGNSGCHSNGVTCGTAVTIYRQTDHIHFHQFTQQAAIFKPGLVAAMVGRGRTPNVGQKLSTAANFVTDSGDVVLIAARA